MTDYSISKFDGPCSEYLYSLSMESGHDEECGDVTECGTWYGLFTFTPEEIAEQSVLDVGTVGAILEENDQGFVGCTVYHSEVALKADWQLCVEHTEGAYEEEGPE